jgi:hypothetical protein
MRNEEEAAAAFEFKERKFMIFIYAHTMAKYDVLK